jgi:hypothetical protein
MIKAIKRILKCLTLVAVAAISYQAYDHYRPQPIEPMTLQRRASHRIEYISPSGRPSGWCTGTVIGPHALLTASHCNKDNGTDTFELDNAAQRFHIEKTLTDNRDHDVYLIDGPAFTNVVPYVVRPSKDGEHVYLYGSGGAAYPPRRLDGIRIGYDDPSDVDADAGIGHFTMPVIPGDSGSAVFNDDGTIAAVTTYLLRDPWMFGYITDVTTLDFVPAFTTDQISEATKFTPTEYHPKAKNSAPGGNPFDPFNLFH